VAHYCRPNNECSASRFEVDVQNAQQTAKKGESVTSEAKASDEQQSLYRSAEALRYPKPDFFAAC
jgi:hypothetical protein